jgi:hypothetical protein
VLHKFLKELQEIWGGTEKRFEKLLATETLNPGSCLRYFCVLFTKKKSHDCLIQMNWMMILQDKR